MAERWGLVVEESRGSKARYAPRVVGEFTGTREEALARLEEIVAEYMGEGGGRRRLFRTADGFLYVYGDTFARGVRFTLAELVSDSEDAKLAAAAEKQAAKERKAAERKARRAARRTVVEDEFEDDFEDEVEDQV